MLWALQAAPANYVPDLAEVSVELYLGSGVSVKVDENRGLELLEMGLAHVAVRLEEHGRTALERVKKAAPLPEVQDLLSEASSVWEHTEAAVVLERVARTTESGRASPLQPLPSS